MTPGANQAIFDGYDKGAITHTSIMANCDYFTEAMEGIHARPHLGLGMHLNLTYGKAIIPHKFYCDKNGIFNLSYKALLSTKNTSFLVAVEAEWDAQIQRVLEASNVTINLTHIDSHRHIHLIPHLYPIVIRLAEKYNISRVRLIRENIIDSFKLTKRFNFILNGGIIKYLLLRIFSFYNTRYHDLYTPVKFYSILYTGVVGKDILRQLQHNPYNYEVMVHPSYPELDTNVHFYDVSEKAYRVSQDRKKELESVLCFPKKSQYV